MISMIWAQGANGEIGYKDEIPWNLPEDMEHFKKTTMGSVVIMGRRTHESIGGPLPGRENIVLTRDPFYSPKGVWVYDSHIKLLNDIGKSKAFVIGGRQVYDLFMPFAEELHITNIHETYKADTYAPRVPKGFMHVSSETHMKETLMYQFSVYKKLGGK